MIGAGDSGARAIYRCAEAIRDAAFTPRLVAVAATSIHAGRTP